LFTPAALKSLRLDLAATASLFDCDNLDFAAVHLHGLADPLVNEQMGKRGHIGDRSAAGIRLVLANNPERLAAAVVTQIVTWEPNATTTVSAGSGYGIALATHSAK
jgi:hypothetical protein